jgi:regulator of replication initiation timing
MKTKSEEQLQHDIRRLKRELLACKTENKYLKLTNRHLRDKLDVAYRNINLFEYEVKKLESE